MVPVLRVGATQVLIITLSVILVFGSLHLYATAHPGSKFAKVWVGVLGF